MTDTASWSAVSEAWGTNAAYVENMKEPLTRAMLKHSRLAAGGRVLEVGSGTGELARVLADVVGTSGHVVATDVAEGMVDLMRARLAELPHVEVRTCDAAETGLPTSHVDAVLARMSLMFSTDPVAAVGEAARVLVPGGRYVAATWAGPMDNMWMAAVGMAAAMNGAWQGSSPMDPGGPFSLSETKQLLALLEEAGLVEAEVIDVPIEVRFSDAAAHFAHVSSMAGPLAVALSGASDDVREAVRRTAADSVARFMTDDGLVFPGLARLAVGSRPA